MSEVARRSTKYHWLLYLVAVILLAVVLRPPMNQIGHDVAIYTLFGQQMVDGKIVYKDLWDKKGPVVYFLFALIVATVGCHPVAINILGTLYLLLIGLGVYLLTKEITDRRGGRVAVVVLLLGAAFPLGQQLNGEMIMELFLVFGLLAILMGLRGRRLLLIAVGGVGIGLALQTKAVALLDALAFASLVVLWADAGQQRRVRLVVARVAFLGLGVVTPTVLFVAYFAYHRALGDFLACSVLHNFGYVSVGEGGSFAHALVDSLQTTILPSSGFWVFGILGAVAILLQLCGHSRSNVEAHTLVPRPVGVALLAWIAAAFVGVLVGRRFYPHYYMHMVPAMAILAGVALSWLARQRQGAQQFMSKTIIVTIVALAVLSLIPRAGPAAYKWRSLATGDVPRFASEKLALWLAEEVHPGENMFVWPFTAYPYLYSGADPASRFFSHWYNPWPPEQKRDDPYQSTFYEIWERDMAAAQPKWIALGRKTGDDPRQWPPERRFLVEWLAGSYTWYAEVAGYDVYRLHGDLPFKTGR